MFLTILDRLPLGCLERLQPACAWCLLCDNPEAGTLFMPILQIRKFTQRTVKWPAQNHTTKLSYFEVYGWEIKIFQKLTRQRWERTLQDKRWHTDLTSLLVMLLICHILGLKCWERKACNTVLVEGVPKALVKSLYTEIRLGRGLLAAQRTKQGMIIFTFLEISQSARY